MEMSNNASGRNPAPQPLTFTRAAHQGLPRPLPATACQTCTVRHLCLPHGLDEEGKAAMPMLLAGTRRLAKGQKLYREGEPFSAVYAVRFGAFKSVYPVDNGGDYVSAFHFPGDLIGFDGMANGSHPTTAIALEAAEVCLIPHVQLLGACAKSAALLKRVTQLMGVQLVREYRCTKLAARRHSEERVAAFLLQLAEWMRERGYSSRQFRLRMSRADIGSHLGTTLETVSRCLSLFAREGLITVRSRQIEMIDSQKLRSSYADRPF